ncbi:efflux RND transporter periplasmic adaptor subunit [Paenibacillus sp. NEAU-GSW1]|uniref:efflux RND transporter periplasmic adaptor subunit n=1 Tax=Paenibacillus sp. NEAU-GSW1 TaxID=2682486 RepID=UPI0012E1670D|nr:efflux RND transporter periplasmic adaptor subunit [Paenibacillus sp. NEAU-GSW1]MUT66158.1 HlyD family efflux transporter periplasmic adaptor subunit [Paenibacillus sp. NEAU-GSW1]
MSMKWWTGNLYKRTAVVMLTASIALTSGCSLLPDEKEEEVLPSIAPPQIAKKPEYEVTTATLETKVQVVGKLISMQEETLYFTLGDKHLKELNVKAGDKVEAGQVIGELDVDLLERDLRNKRLAFKREERTMKDALRMKDEMDPIEFEEKTINFEQKQQELADLEAEIGKATLVAPFGGTVVQLNVKKGDLIKAYDPIVVIADTSKMTPAAKLSKDDLAKIAVGMPVVVDINSAGQFKGTVKVLPLPSNDQQNGGGGTNGEPEQERPEDFMLVDIKDLPKGINRGTPLSINVITKRKENVVVIPPSALRNLGSRTYVQVVDADGKREVDVEVGQQTATQVEIISGLEPGQKVVGR